MAKAKKALMIPDELVVNKIYVIHGQKIMLDRDLAELYGVETKRLKEAVRILKGVHGIRFITFTEKDVARHHLVQEIIMAYERDESHASVKDLLEKG